MSDFPHTEELEAAAQDHRVRLSPAQPLAGDGSERRFFRLPGRPALVLVFHPHPPGGKVTENDSYFFLGRHLKSRGVPVPEIYRYCREEGWFLVEDVGEVSLESLVKSQASGPQLRDWYHQALKILVNMQLEGAAGFDSAWCFDTPAVDAPFLKERECHYFVRAFLKGYLGLAVAEKALASDFDRLLTRALPPGPNFFLHRDYQSRNLFLKDGHLRVLDFQGGRWGPLPYDVAALLIDPYAALPPEVQQEFLAHYLGVLGQFHSLDGAAFREQYHYLALCRNLQILGAFGFLTRVKGKPWFEGYIPRALSNLRGRLKERPGEFPGLEKVVGSL